MRTPRLQAPATRFLTILGIVLLAAILRLSAATQLPTDFDEPDYVQAGYGYAAAMRAGDLDRVIDYPNNREHPPLVKLTYGLAILALGERANWNNALYAARLISAAFGVLAVLLLALVDPLAGLLLAADSLVVKYTSQAYLEALPFCAGLAAVLALSRSRAPRDRWFWLSAAAAGVTAAGKFTYFPVIFPIFYLAVVRQRRRWSDLLFYLGVAAAVFWALNPALWHAPLSRLADMLLLHVRYSQGSNVQAAGYPWYQPWLWLSRPAPWHPQVFFYVGTDGIIFWLATLGAVLERRTRPWLLAWLIGGMAVLLLWRTKWPQYTLVLVPALCLAAATGLRWLVGRVREWEERWHVLGNIFPMPSRSFWLVTGLLAAALLLGLTANSLRTAAGRAGWSHMTAQTTPLPNNTVHALLALSNGMTPGSMAVGTDRGLAVWAPPAAPDLPARWTIFTASRSDLPQDQVLALAQDGSSRLWAGTAGGLGCYDGAAWRTYRAADFGLRGERVNALGVDSAGRVWIGTDAGAAVFDGKRWQAYTAATSGLANDYVLSLAIERRSGGDVLWFGLLDAISRLDAATGQWASFTAAAADLGPGGIGSLYVDAAGQVWAGSLGGGLSRWDGASWRGFRTSNSDIPNNTVQEIFESAPGLLWIGTALPADVGGTVSAYDGNAWRWYTSSNSGYSGAEPLSLALDAQGRLWIGTQTAGVDVLRLEN